MGRDARDVDWVAIRQEWENSDVTDAQLATLWGFGSKTTIARRRTGEGWTRNLAAVADALAASAVREAGVPGPVSRHVSGHVSAGHMGASGTNTPAQNAATAGVGAFGVSRNGANRGSGAEGDEDLAHGGEGYHLEPVADRGGLGAPDDLVRARVRVKARQIRSSERMIETSELFIDLLHTIATASLSSPLGHQAIEDAKLRLQAINPDKDSVSTLVKSFQSMAEGGFKLLRQALGMDLDERKPAAAGAGQGDGPHASSGAPQLMGRALELMDEGTLMKIRDVTVQLGRMSPLIEGSKG